MKALLREDYRMGVRGWSRTPFGAKNCEGGCGKAVSANKNKCLDCLGKEVSFRLKVGGIEATPSEIQRALYAQIGR